MYVGAVVLAEKNSTMASPTSVPAGTVTVWLARLPLVWATPSNATGLATSVTLKLSVSTSVSLSSSVTVSVAVCGPGAL